MSYFLDIKVIVHTDHVDLRYLRVIEVAMLRSIRGTFVTKI